MNAGSWSAVMPWPLIGIHAALLPDGRVLTFGSDQRGEQGLHKIYDIWDPKTGVHLTTTDAIATDEFCSAEILDPITDDLVIAGGDGRPQGNVNKGVRRGRQYLRLQKRRPDDESDGAPEFPPLVRFADLARRWLPARHWWGELWHSLISSRNGHA